MSGIVVGALALTPPPPEEYIWTKGPYTITSTVGGVREGKQLHYWSWEYQGEKGNRPVIEHKTIPTWFSSVAFSRGAAGFSKNIDVDKLDAGFGLQLSVGRLLEIPLKNTHLQLAASINLAGKLEKGEKQAASRRMQVTNYILEAAPVYRWPNSKWMAGAGLAYYTGSTIRFNFRENEKLNDNFGVLGIIEYAYNRRVTLGSRIDLINQKTPSGLEYNGSSFGLYAKSFF